MTERPDLHCGYQTNAAAHEAIAACTSLATETDGFCKPCHELSAYEIRRGSQLRALASYGFGRARRRKPD
jgi:hypothetical protein